MSSALRVTSSLQGRRPTTLPDIRNEDTNTSVALEWRFPTMTSLRSHAGPTAPSALSRGPIHHKTTLACPTPAREPPRPTPQPLPPPGDARPPQAGPGRATGPRRSLFLHGPPSPCRGLAGIHGPTTQASLAAQTGCMASTGPPVWLGWAGSHPLAPTAQPGRFVPPQPAHMPTPSSDSVAQAEPLPSRGSLHPGAETQETSK